MEIFRLYGVVVKYAIFLKSVISKFRAISIISNFAKALDILIHDVIYSKIGNKISIHQHVFTKSRSTTTKLVCIMQYISESIHNQGQTDVLYIFFQGIRSFDKLDHEYYFENFMSLGFLKNYFFSPVLPIGLSMFL